MKKSAILLLVLIIFMLGNLFAQKTKQVKVESGLLQGIIENDVNVYKGVPFAAPPIGDLRWKAPQPVIPWKGVKQVDKFSANQIQTMYNEFGPWTSEYQPKGEISEDCLYLNVWTTAKSSKEKRPVMFYIPGGAFTGGSGNVPVYNGENLAKKGLVVITINYRVGVIGFLAHPELTKESPNNSSGNYGLLDQLAALKWVKKNISGFGGDPNRITIVGQSAGAGSVHYLTASPLAKGLFIRAIPQSGSNASIGPAGDIKSAEQNGVKFAQAKSVASIAELRKLSAADLTAATQEQFRFSPIVDGWYLPKTAEETFAAGGQNDVTTLTGLVADEGSSNNDYGKLTSDAFKTRVKFQTVSLADELLKYYPTSTDEEVSESQKAFARDLSMVSMYQWAVNKAKTSKTKTFTYIFTHEQPGETKSKYHAFHSSEIPYAFDNLHQSPRPWNLEDEKISNVMTSYWVNFIKKGDPNGKNLPAWNEFNKALNETMELGNKFSPRPIAQKEQFDILLKVIQSNPQRR